MTVFDSTREYNVKQDKMFFGDSLGIARYDQLRYPQFDLLTEKQLSFFWRPQEVVLTKDIKDFRDLTPHEQHIFTSNLKRQILLDSVQGRAPLLILPIVSLPELENWIVTWTFSEQIHSKSYTHIIRNVYSDPSLVFDGITKMQEIIDCAKDISSYYDELNTLINLRQANPSALGPLGGDYRVKKALWLCLNSINALEGVRFYVSFACSWAFAELKKMEGNAKIIKLICRDENLHLSGTQKILDILPQEDSDFAQIKHECESEVQKMFLDVVDQEKTWADYLFKDGSMIGLNADILKQYVEHIAHKRMKSIGVTSPFKGGTNPLPWTDKWIAGHDVQVAPQETEITSYTVGAVSMDVDENTFEGFEL